MVQVAWELPAMHTLSCAPSEAATGCPGGQRLFMQPEYSCSAEPSTLCAPPETHKNKGLHPYLTAFAGLNGWEEQQHAEQTGQ